MSDEKKTAQAAAIYRLAEAVMGKSPMTAVMVGVADLMMLLALAQEMSERLSKTKS